MLHTFYLIPNNINPLCFAQYEKNPEDVYYGKIEIEDDIIQFLYPTFERIPNRNPTKTSFPVGNGLHYYGVTLFDCYSTAELKKVCLHWKNLFQQCSFIINLKLPYSENEHIQIKKNLLLYQLDKLIYFANQTQTEDYYIYHMGI